MIARDHHHPNACCMALRDGLCNIGPQWVLQADKREPDVMLLYRPSLF
jgi:hypothetical protein